MTDWTNIKPEDIDFVDLTDDQKKKWRETIMLMHWMAPGFTHLFYKLLINHKRAHQAVPWFTRIVPIAATDAKNILINPDTFFALKLAQRVFVLCHEVVHNMYKDVEFLKHCSTTGIVPMNDGSTLPFDNETMQKAMDYRINALLVESKLGDMPPNCCYDLKIAGANDGITATYAKCYKKKNPPGGGGGGGGQPDKGEPEQQPFDDLLPPNVTAPDAPPRNDAQWEVEIGIAQSLERLRGDVPGVLERLFKDILEPEVSWTDVINSMIKRKTGAGGYDWRRPDRRYITRDIYLPGRTGYGAGHIVIWGDTSGSIGDTELNGYFGELGGIIEDVRPKRLTVIWGDHAVQKVSELEDANDLRQLHTEGTGKGGGGTSVKPVFEWIKENCQEPPELFIGLTDGDFVFPKRAPTFEVIWASIKDNTYPWGDVVKINRKGKAA